MIRVNIACHFESGKSTSDDDNTWQIKGWDVERIVLRNSLHKSATIGYLQDEIHSQMVPKNGVKCTSTKPPQDCRKQKALIQKRLDVQARSFGIL